MTAILLLGYPAGRKAMPYTGLLGTVAAYYSLYGTDRISH